METSRDCLWDQLEVDAFRRLDLDVREHTPVRTADRRSRTRDMSPTRDNRRTTVASGNRRSLSIRCRMPSPSAVQLRRLSPHEAGESTPVMQNTRARQPSRCCPNIGNPTALLVFPVCATGDHRCRAHSSPPISRSRSINAPSITVPQFDGKGDLQIFLSKFSTTADLFAWGDRERAQRLRLQ